MQVQWIAYVKLKTGSSEEISPTAWSENYATTTAQPIKNVFLWMDTEDISHATDGPHTSITFITKSKTGSQIKK